MLILSGSHHVLIGQMSHDNITNRGNSSYRISMSLYQTRIQLSFDIFSWCSLQNDYHYNFCRYNKNSILLTLIEQLINDERFSERSIWRKRSSGALLSSKCSTTPPVKSVIASEVLPPFKDSNPPYNLEKKKKIKGKVHSIALFGPCTLRRLFPVGHSRIHFHLKSEWKWVVHYEWVACHRSQYPPTRQNTRTWIWRFLHTLYQTLVLQEQPIIIVRN